MSEVLEFGPFRLDVEENLLSRDGAAVPLTPKAFATLTLLVRNQGRLLEKETMLRAIWPDAIVEEATLAQNISSLRRSLGESESNRYIETVPKRGYRFVAQVRRASSLAEATREETQPRSNRRTRKRWAVAAAMALFITAASVALVRSYDVSESAVVVPPRRETLAILPFKSLSADRSDDYFGLAMTDALITRMGNVRGVVVRPTAAVRQFADHGDPIKAARALEVDAVLDGTIQRDGDRARVSVQLFDVRSRAQIWGDNFDVPFTDLFSVQDHLSLQVAEATLARLEFPQQRRHHTDKPEAYEAYVKGRYFWNKRTEEGFRRAIEQFDFALTRDPEFALAMSGLADSYALLGSMPTQFITRQEAMSRARAHATRAIAIDRSLAEAHASLAFVKMHYDWDWKGAEVAFRKAIALNPGYATAHHWYTYFLLSQGRTREAAESIRKAEKLDPLSLIIATDVAEVLVYAHRFDEACAQIEKVLQMDRHFPLAHRVAADCYRARGNPARGLDHLKISARLGRDDSLLQEASVLLAMGRQDEAREAYQRMRRELAHSPNAAVSIGHVALRLGLRDEAFEHIERALAERSGSLILAKVDFHFDSVRGDPRYKDLLRRMNLPQ